MLRDLTHAEELREFAQEAQDPFCDWTRIYERTRHIVDLHTAKSFLPMQEEAFSVLSALFRNPTCDIHRVLQDVVKSGYTIGDSIYYNSRRLYEDIGKNPVCPLWVDAQEDAFMRFLRESGRQAAYANIICASSKYDRSNPESLPDKFAALLERIENLSFPPTFDRYFLPRAEDNGWNARFVYEVNFLGLQSVPAYNDWWKSSSFGILLHHGLGLEDHGGLLPPLAYMYQDQG